MISRQRRSYAYVSVWATMASEEIDAVSLRQRMEALPVACCAYPIHCTSFQLSSRVEDFRVRAPAFVADHFAPNLSKKRERVEHVPFLHPAQGRLYTLVLPHHPVKVLERWPKSGYSTCRRPSLVSSHAIFRTLILPQLFHH